MSSVPVISPAMLEQFRREGALFLPNLLSPDGVTRARDVVRCQFNRLGLRRDGAWQMPDPLPQWPSAGIKPARDIGHRQPEIDALTGEPAVLAIVHALTNGSTIDQTIHPGSQVLASLPNAGPWVLPDSWHIDTPRLPSGKSPGVQIFTFLEPARPRGGATLVIAGSHRLFDNGEAMKTKHIVRGLRGESFFEGLAADRHRYENPDAGLPSGSAQGVPLQIMELTGNPGDAWMTDLRVLHAGAPNAAETPRVMVTRRYIVAELVPEVAAAYGWL